MGVLERDEEIRLLREEVFGDGRRETGSVVLIESAAGNGKTCLLHTFAGQVAESGAAFLGASATKVEHHLPLSTISQLFHSPALSVAERGRAERLLRDGALAATAYGGNGDLDATARVPAASLGGLSEILLAAAERTPLVIGVDDIHYADVSSLRFLLYLARRTGNARVLLVLTTCLGAFRSPPPLYADLLRLPITRRLRLPPLSKDGVAELLTERLGPAVARRLAPECHLVSGGNPLIVQALADDHPMSGADEPDAPVFGSAFRQAVLTCLYHSETVPLARAIAVLGADASAPLVSKLVHPETESIDQSWHVLRATGLLGETGFRHHAVETAVLTGMRPEERTALFTRAAELLYDHGAPATTVADRLVAADDNRVPWGVPLLRDAAEQAVAEGRHAAAIDYLRLALRDCTDEQRRAAVRLDLARAEWWTDPAIAARHLPELARAARLGRLPADGISTLADMMLWLGRLDDVLETLAELVRDTGVRRATAVRRAIGVRFSWLREIYPQLGEHDLMVAAFGRTEAGVSLRRALGDQELPVGLSARDRRDRVLTEIERLLQQSGPAGDLTQLGVLASLVYMDELERAEWWCDTFGKSAGQSPEMGQALITSLRAAIHLRRGEPRAAERHARAALDLVPARGWGVAVGFPLATLISALTAMGDHAGAQKLVDLPVPEAMSDTLLVLPYLQARGRHHLAMGRPQAALAEFRACGRLMTEWRVDLPGFVPWRSDLADVHLCLGRPREARRLAAEQLTRATYSGSRTRGLTLCTLAGVYGAEQRVKLLSTAVELLEEAGDRLELARAVAGLSEAYRATGQADTSAALARRVDLLLAECGADDVRAALPPIPGAPPDTEPDPLTELSDAERRVAAYAARGYTNRQIARKLRVTMSTVEQHLTRVYRKLNITRRADLPLNLALTSQEFPV